MNPVLKGYFFEKRLRLLLRLVLMMCYYINNVEKRFLIPNADRFWYERGLRSSDRFLYNYMINLLLCSQSILEEWLRDSAYALCVRVRVCALFFVPTDIQKSNNVKLVQVVFPSALTKVTLLALPPLTKCCRRCCKYCVRSANVFQVISKVRSWNAFSEELAIVSIA